MELKKVFTAIVMIIMQNQTIGSSSGVPVPYEKQYIVKFANQASESDSLIPKKFILTQSDVCYFSALALGFEMNPEDNCVELSSDYIAPENFKKLLDAVRSLHTGNWGLIYSLMKQKKEKTQRKQILKYAYLYNQAELLGFGFYNKSSQEIESDDFLEDMRLCMQGMLTHYIPALATVYEKRQDAIIKQLVSLDVVRNQMALLRRDTNNIKKMGHKIAVMYLFSKMQSMVEQYQKND